MGPLDVLWMMNEAGYPRLGLIVPRFQSTAVARNRLRRRLKELWRRGVQHRVGNLDVVIRARPDAYRVPYASLERELIRWTETQRA